MLAGVQTCPCLGGQGPVSCTQGLSWLDCMPAAIKCPLCATCCVSTRCRAASCSNGLPSALIQRPLCHHSRGTVANLMHLHGSLSAAYGTGAAPGAAKAGRGGGSTSTAADRGLVEERWMALPDAELTAQQKATKAEFVKKMQVRCCPPIGALCICRCRRAHCPAGRHPG